MMSYPPSPEPAKPTSFSALLKKPSTKAKPDSLRGKSIRERDHENLEGDLLEEDEPLDSPPTYRAPDRSLSLSFRPGDSYRPEDSFRPDESFRPGDSFRSGDSHRLVVAIDYGTTYTGVAFATPHGSAANLTDVEVMDNWGVRMRNSGKIPSVYSYSPASNKDQPEEQWGLDLSPDAVAMVNTKLELDVQANKSEELELILYALEGMNNLDFQQVRATGGNPDFTWKSPEEIATDYLTKVFTQFIKCLDASIDSFGPQLRATFPVDIVVTVPVKWSYRATNSTFKAIRNAGFNEENFPKLRDIIVVSEPEAAAVFTAQSLKESLGREFLQVRECFILCDAGGGTVDAASYRVKELEPSLEIERVGFPTSAKCGSVHIDASFKRWLRGLVGERWWRILDPKSSNRRVNGYTTEGGLMRMIMRDFDGCKKSFGSTRGKSSFKIALPTELDQLNVRGRIEEGILTITHEEMRSFFDQWVDQIVELIQGQIQQVDKERRRVKQIFLVGGFAESEYLQSEIRASMGLRKIQLHRPENSWTAVIRGAVMYGIERNDHQNLRTMKACPKNYGIVLDEVFSGARNSGVDQYTNTLTKRAMARKQMSWLILKGDLLLSDEPKKAEKECQFSFRETDSRRFQFPIFEYPDMDVPRRFEGAQDELKQVLVLNCDLSRLNVDEFDRYENNGNPYYVASLMCKMELTCTFLTVQIVWNDQVICSAKKEMEAFRSWN